VTRAVLAGAAGIALFLVLATANSGGYRFGVSDQAYYVPAIQQHLDPTLFPRDGEMLNAQSHLMTSDELMSGVVSFTGASLPGVAATFYVLSLLVLAGAAVAFARGLQFSWWTVAAFGVLLTLRHRITKTGANSLEGYMHPRQLAFGLGVAALACLLRDRLLAAVALVALAGVLHPTTALWFGLALAVGIAVRRPTWRLHLMGAAAVAAAIAIWAVTTGPMAARMVTMDASWLTVLASKDYLFPTDWPIDAWLINLAYPVVIWFTWRARHARGLAVPGEEALVWGSLALTALFLISVPLTAMKLALAVQLQITRVFWVMDFIALGYVAWWVTRHHRVAAAVVGLLALASAGRGYYLLEVNQPERRVATISLPHTPWNEAMTWLRAQPNDWHVLADPDHAWKHGVSLRLAATKDTVLESVKDSAISLYDRDIAMRVAARTRDLVDYDRLTTTRVMSLATTYDLDAVIVETDHLLDLPVLYRNERFVIYDLR
jgi:hypothetical protein